ncbi:MAG: TOMM system kinase/cyclase fusion protein, partial [Burkholderiaceae bacterium]|nr:TOMM system kinase/cyclase fusion protein [Burkholderiaceae bacterium]
RETAQLAGAIGREFDYALLAAVALADEATLQADLDELVAAGLIYRQRRVRDDSYVFRHALIRDAAYDAMPRRAQKQTHARIAHWLEQRPPAQLQSRLAQLAHHFALAEQYGGAVRYGTDAALLLLERALHDDAIVLAETVLVWIGELATPERRPAEIGISRILTHALMSKYGWADARVKEAAERALRLIEGIDDARRTVPTLWAMAFYHHVASNRESVRTLTAQLLLLSAASEEGGLGVACHTMHGIACWIDGGYRQAAAAFEHVLDRYDAAEHANHGYVFGLDSRVWAMAGLANVRWFADTDDGAAFALAREAVARARALNHIPSLGVALMYLAFLHHYAEDRAGARAVCEQLLGLSHQYGLPAVEGYAAMVHSWSTCDLDAADRVLEGLRGMGCMLGLTYLASLPAETEARAGNHGAALARIEACLLLCDDIDEPYYKPELLRRRAQYRAAAAAPDGELIRADLDCAITLAERAGMRRSALGARVALAAFDAMSNASAVVSPKQASPEVSST